MDNKGLLPKKDNGILTKDGVSFLIPFILITTCFALWGFANDVTSPMVKAFSKIFRMNVTEGAMVQVAFYLGYFVMAFPAALFIEFFNSSKLATVLAVKGAERGHSTASEAAEIARLAGAKRLLIGHYSSRYNDTDELLQQARAVFPDTIAATEGMKIALN